LASIAAALALAPTASAQTIFTENFNGITGAFIGVQHQSSNALAVSADLAGWAKAGAGTLHAVDHDGAGDLAPMLWGGDTVGEANILTLSSAIAGSNAGGTTYEVNFVASPSVYAGGGQESTAADGVLIEVLRGDNSVLTSYTSLPGAWAGNMAFVADGFQYIGDGTGDIRFRLSPSNPGVGRFNSAIDDLMLSQAAAAPIVLANGIPTDRHLRSATLNATLGVPNTNAQVRVYWGTTDGTNNPSAWAENAYVGSWGNVTSVSIGRSVTGLEPGTTYHYTFRATSDGLDVWATPSKSFSTLVSPAFSENFNGISGGGSGTQADTGLGLKAAATLSGWTSEGANDLHAVNLDGAGNWAIMFWQDNVMTLDTYIDANETGVIYNVTFDYGTGTYAGTGQATMAGDGLLVEVLRINNSVLASTNVAPGAWASGNYNLDAGHHGVLPYMGDGSGYVRLRVGPTPPYDSGRFEGSIDNLSITIPAPPPPAGTILCVR